MEKIKPKLSTIADIATELRLNKSRISYYVKMGLLVPKERTKYHFLFDHDSTVERVKELMKLKKNRKKNRIYKSS